MIILAVAAGCSQTSTLPSVSATPSGMPLPASIKGYELYSWLDEGVWHFVLITGTNRSKTSEEITSGENVIEESGWVKVTVQGVEALTTALDGLPATEEIFWSRGENLVESSEPVVFDFPPGDLVDQIRDYCDQIGLKLHIEP